MTKNTDAHDAELLDPAVRGKGRSSVHRQKHRSFKADGEIIDVTIAEDSSSISSDKTDLTAEAASCSISGKAGDETSAIEAELIDIDADPTPEAELVEAEEAFDDLDGFEEDGQVIEIGSNLPALAQDRLPSVPVRDNLQSYLREVSRFPLLEPEEETALARRVRDHGDSEAAFRIISSHLRLVVRIAMDFQRRWMQNVLDLIQEGNVGLLRAVNKFDPDKGIKFSYYASFWIKAYILKFIMDNWRMVKIGTTQAQRKLFYNLNRERQKLILQGFDPDAALLSQRLGVTQDQVQEMQQRLDAGDVSLDTPVSDENGSATRMDFLPALGPGIEEGFADSEMSRLVRDCIEDLMPTLSEKEIYILENRLLTDEPATLREIGEKYSVTRERIRQLEARLLEKLKEHLGREIKDFSEDWIHP